MVGGSLSSLSFTWTRKSLKIHSPSNFLGFGGGVAEPRPGWISLFLIYLHKSRALKPVLTEGRRRFSVFYFLWWEGETEWMERASYLFPPGSLIFSWWLLRERLRLENDWGFLMRGLEILRLPGPTVGSLWSRAERHFFHHPENQHSCGSLRTSRFGLLERVAQYEH